MKSRRPVDSDVMRLTLLTLLCIALITPAQKPDAPPTFAGTWKLKSTSKNTSTGSTAKREVGDEIVITQADDHLTFTGTTVVGDTTQTNHLTFYTDGRGEENLWVDSKRPFKTVTAWVKGVLQIVETTEVTFRGARYGVKKANLIVKEEWKLSKDGQTLTQRINDNWFDIDPMVREIRGTSAYSTEVKHVYQRK